MSAWACFPAALSGRFFFVISGYLITLILLADVEKGRVDYFAPDADRQLLFHTWRLAVEERFYIVFPLLLFGLLRFGKREAFVVLASG